MESMEGDYLTPEDPPSCAVTCLGLIAAGMVLAVIIFIAIFVRPETIFFSYYPRMWIVAVICSALIIPVA
jgi:hypothetical protein